MVLVGHEHRPKYYAHHDVSWKMPQRQFASHAINYYNPYATMMPNAAYTQQQQQHQQQHRRYPPQPIHHVLPPQSALAPMYHQGVHHRPMPEHHPVYYGGGYYESYETYSPAPTLSPSPEPAIPPHHVQHRGFVEPARPLGTSSEKPTAEAVSEALAVSQLASLGSRKAAATTTPPTQLQIVTAIHLAAHGPNCAFHSAIAAYGAKPALHKRPGDGQAHIDFILPDGSLDCQLKCCGNHKSVLPQAVARHFSDRLADFTASAARRQQQQQRQQQQRQAAATVDAAASRVLHPSTCPQFLGPAHF